MSEKEQKKKTHLNILSSVEPITINTTTIEKDPSEILPSLKTSRDYEKETQAYSTFGDKLLQHTDVLYSIQKERTFKPITVQLGPTEACFTGDVKVSLLNGTERTLQDLAENEPEPFWVYSYDIENKKIVPGKALRSRLTRKNSELVKVTLDNGEIIRCTPDHNFLLRTGEYCEAENLQLNCELMSLELFPVSRHNDKISYQPTHPEKSHKFISIEWLPEKEDVYCLEVEKYHNFALTNGIYSKNCSSNCPFCSVGWRDVTKKIPWESIVKILKDFKELGAKSLEISGSGSPLLYKDGIKNINDIISLAYDLGYDIGIISNEENPSRYIKEENKSKLKWLRTSLIKLDEGKTPEDFNFDGFTSNQLGFSYIIYEGTTKESIEKIAKLVELHPDIKFVRIAADCLTDKSITVKKEWGDVISEIDKHQKFFIKEINDNFHAYEQGCYVGLVRPYCTHNGIYLCTSHVLKHRDYHPTWKMCDHHEIKETWNKMNERFKQGLPPYEINIKKDCWKCYYSNNNQLLHTVATELPDKNFA